MIVMVLVVTIIGKGDTPICTQKSEPAIAEHSTKWRFQASWQHPIWWMQSLSSSQKDRCSISIFLAIYTCLSMRCFVCCLCSPFKDINDAFLVKKSGSQIPFWERATCLDCKNWAARCLCHQIRRICKKNHFRCKNQRIFHGISLLAISDYVASPWPLSKRQEVCDIGQGLLWISSYPLLGLKMMVCNQHFF